MTTFWLYRHFGKNGFKNERKEEKKKSLENPWNPGKFSALRNKTETQPQFQTLLCVQWAYLLKVLLDFELFSFFPLPI